MKRFLFGSLLGSVIGSVFLVVMVSDAGPIQSQVGINSLEHDTNTWQSIRAYDVGDVTAGTFALPGGATPNIIPVFVVKPDFNNNNWSVDTPVSASPGDADGAQATQVVPYCQRNSTPTYRNWYQASLADGQTTLSGGFGICATSNLVLNRSGTTNTWKVQYSHYTQSTTGVTTNAAGTTMSMTETPMTKYTLVVDRTAGTTNPVEIDLQCSLDAAIWVQIATITDLTNEPVLTSVEGVPCAAMRYNVVTVGSGNTLTIQLLATR